VSNSLSRGWSASLALATVVATGAGVVAACGGGGGAKAAATPTSGGATAASYIACLTAHGYPPPANLIQRIEHPPTTDANGNGGGGGFGGGGFGGGGAGAGGGPGATDSGGTTRTTLDPATQAARQAAFTACQSQAPAGVRVPGAGGAGAFGGQFLNGLRTYISCLNDHGYTAVTTPPTTAANQPPPTGQNQGLRSTLSKIQSDPAAANARQACAAIAPTFPGRGTTTTSTTA